MERCEPLVLVRAELSTSRAMFSEGTGEGARLTGHEALAPVTAPDGVSSEGFGFAGVGPPAATGGRGEPARGPKAPLGRSAPLGVPGPRTAGVPYIGRHGLPTASGFLLGVKVAGVKFAGIGGAFMTLFQPGGGGPLPIHFFTLGSGASKVATPIPSRARLAASRRAASTAAASTGSASTGSSSPAAPCRALIVEWPAALGERLTAR